MIQKFTYNQIVHLNAELNEKKIPFRICYKNEKVAGIEGMGSCTCNGKEDLLKEEVIRFFKKEGLRVTFSEDGVEIRLYKSIEVVAAIIKGTGINEGKFFATQRGYGEFKDGWEFPGGKIEEGETPQKALEREIKEELNTVVEILNLLCTVEYDYPVFHLTMQCYLCKVVSGKLTLLEHEAAKWLGKDEINSVEWLAADVAVVEKLKKAVDMIEV